MVIDEKEENKWGKVKKSHKVTNLRKLLIADLLSSFELFHLNQTRTVETKDKVTGYGDAITLVSQWTQYRNQHKSNANTPRHIIMLVHLYNSVGRRILDINIRFYDTNFSAIVNITCLLAYQDGRPRNI